MQSETFQIIKSVLIFSIAGATAAGGWKLYIAVAQSLIGCFGILASAVLSIALTVKVVSDWKSNKRLKQAEIDDIRARREHELGKDGCN